MQYDELFFFQFCTAWHKIEKPELKLWIPKWCYQWCGFSQRCKTSLSKIPLDKISAYKNWFQLTKINDSPFFTNAGRTLAFIILSVAWLVHIYFFVVSWINDPHNPIPLGYASPSLFWSICCPYCQTASQSLMAPVAPYFSLWI